jgi:hypothetical protein
MFVGEEAASGRKLALKVVRQDSQELVNVKWLCVDKSPDCARAQSVVVATRVVEGFAEFLGRPMCLLVMDLLEPMPAWALVAPLRNVAVAVALMCEVRVCACERVSV